MSAQKRRHEETADWILRLQAPHLSVEDKQAFEDWLKADPKNRLSFEAAQSLMGHAGAALADQPDFASEILDEARRSKLKPTLAILALLIAGGSYAFLPDVWLRMRADLVSGPNETRSLTFADGSTALLNASSAVAYTFTPTQRRIALLKGEAFFTVAPDKSRPFVVEAQGARTTAVGTAFDVRLDEEATKVTVAEHAVTIDADKAGQSIRVEEGQQAAYGPNGTIGTAAPVDLDVALAWRRGELVVENAPLSFVARELDRHYAGRILIASKSLAQRRVSGRFSIVDTDAALAFLERTLGLTVTRFGPLIVLRDS